MPLHNDKPVDNTTSVIKPVRVAERDFHARQLTESGIYRLYNTPVRNWQVPINLSFLDDRKKLRIQVPEHQFSDMKIFAADGVDVLGFDSFDTQARVIVQTTGGDHFKARDYVYTSNQDKTSINCAMKAAGRPLDEQDLQPYPVLLNRVNSYKLNDIACRHMVMHSIIARRDAKQQGVSWQETINHDFSKENIQKTFPDMLKAELDWHDMLFLGRDVYKVTNLSMLPASCGALLKGLRQFMVACDEIYAVGDTLRRTYIFSLTHPGGGHATQVELSIRKEDRGEYTYKMKFYDPNMSYTHRSFATKDVRSFDFMDVESFVGPLAKDYGRDFDSFHLVEVANNWQTMYHEEQSGSRFLHRIFVASDLDEVQEEIISVERTHQLRGFR